MTDIELLRFSVQSKEHLQYMCAEWAENTLVYHLASELLKVGELLNTEHQKVKELSASEWNLAGELVALQGNGKPVAYAVRNHFWKGGRPNFQGKYHDLHFAENLKSAWDVQIPLFTTQPASCVVLTQLMVDTIIPAIDPDGLDEELHHCEYVLYRDRERIRRQLQEAGCIAKDGE